MHLHARNEERHVWLDFRFPTWHIVPGWFFFYIKSNAFNYYHGISCVTVVDGVGGGGCYERIALTVWLRLRCFFWSLDFFRTRQSRPCQYVGTKCDDKNTRTIEYGLTVWERILPTRRTWAQYSTIQPGEFPPTTSPISTRRDILVRLSLSSSLNQNVSEIQSPDGLHTHY